MTNEQRDLLDRLHAHGSTGAELWALPTEPLAKVLAARCATIAFSVESDRMASVAITERGSMLLSDPGNPALEE
jgi:hypothetical protein